MSIVVVCSGVGSRDLQVWLSLTHAWFRFYLSHEGLLEICCDRLLYYYYLCTPFILGRDTLELYICVTLYSCKELFVKKHSAASKMWCCWRTVKQFSRVEFPSDLRSATIYIEVRCMMSYFFGGGGKSYRHQPRERHHIHRCTWYIWLLCAQWWDV